MIDGYCVLHARCLWDITNLEQSFSLYVLICDLDSERFRRHLLEMDMLDFNKAIQLCQLIEATAVDLQHWTETKDPESVAAVSAKAGCMGVSEKPEEGGGYSKGGGGKAMSQSKQ